MPAAQATVTPAPAPTKDTGVSPPPDPIHSDDGGVLFSEFADLDALDDTPKPQPKAKPAVNKPETKSGATSDKPDTKPDVKSDKPDVKKDDADLSADKKTGNEPETKAPEKPVKAADLRTAYDNIKRRVRDELEPKVKQLESKLKEYESKPKQDDDLKAALQRLEAVEKRRAELEDEIRFVNYQKSEEYVTKYDKPYKEAWQKAISELSELRVEDADGNMRPASAQDLVTLANMSLGDAWKLAKEMFGDAADEIMAHRRKIRELSEAQQKALEDAQKNGGEREKQRALEAKQAHEKTLAMWHQSNQALSQKYPRWFAPEDGDDEGNAMLEKGYKLVDRMFAASEDNPGPQTPEEAVRLHTLVRHKAAAFDRQTLRLKRAQSRIAELEEELKAYEKSEPHGGEKGGGTTTTSDGGTNWEAEIEALDRP